MKIGSRPIWGLAPAGGLGPPRRTLPARGFVVRIARTGELTPPGRTFRARSLTALMLPTSGRALLGVRRVPFGVVRREVVEPDLLVLGRRVERGTVVGTHFAGLGDRVEHRVALLLGAAVGHREDAVGPIVVSR